MRLILETEALQAYSMTMYAGWRAVVAAFVARRLGVKPADLVPQTVAWTMLGVALVGLRALAGGRVGVAARRAGRRFDTVSAGSGPRPPGVEKIRDWGVGVRAATATIRV